ncbi:hypothetical protein [Chitinilyticum aquatile]|nr:hypothetical protein [Chitinilyticum aquatile]
MQWKVVMRGHFSSAVGTILRATVDKWHLSGRSDKWLFEGISL